MPSHTRFHHPSKVSSVAQEKKRKVSISEPASPNLGALPRRSRVALDSFHSTGWWSWGCKNNDTTLLRATVNDAILLNCPRLWCSLGGGGRSTEEESEDRLQVSRSFTKAGGRGGGLAVLSGHKLAAAASSSLTSTANRFWPVSI